MAFGIDDAINAGAAILPNLGSWFGIGEGRQDRRQINQQKKLNQLGVDTYKQTLDLQKQKELDMLEATSWDWQLKKAKEAGLSTAWLMGKGGGTQAQMGGSGPGMSIASAADAAATQNANTNNAMAMAQIQNIQANTAKTEAETSNITGVDKNLKEAQTKDLLQGVTNKQTINAIDEIEKRLKEIQEFESNLSRYGRLHQIEQAAKLIDKQLEIINNDATISSETKQSKINEIKQRAIGAALENALTKAKTAESKAKTAETNQNTEAIKQSIMQAWKELALKGRAITNQELNETARTNLQTRGVRVTEDAQAQKELMDGVNTVLEVTKIFKP